MGILWYYLLRDVCPLNQVFFCLAFQLPLRKRAHARLRLTLCLLIGLLLTPALVLFSTLVTPDLAMTLSDSAYYLSIFVFLLAQMGIMLILFWLDCDISLGDAVYGTACAYTVQHLSDTVIMLLFPETNNMDAAQHLVYAPAEFLISLLVLVGGYILVARQLPENGRYESNTMHSWLSALTVLGFALSLSYYAKILMPTSGTAMFRVCMLFDLLFCVFMLWVQVSRQRERRLIHEVQVERIIRARQREEFEVARDSVERVNRKCHELKHQVAAIRQIADTAEQQRSLAELEQAVVFYDYMVKSGNEVIDTVLTQKGLLCEQAGITWTCMADGATLEFIEAGDLYLLFDSALENAIEAVQHLTDTRHRIIALTLHRKRDMAFLQIENYYDGTLTWEHDLPVSTKPRDGTHGYGLKNMQSVILKYHGTMSITAENNLFLLSILLPIPDTHA